MAENTLNRAHKLQLLFGTFFDMVNTNKMQTNINSVQRDVYQSISIATSVLYLQ
jgi:hypothetical protein